MPSPKSKNKIKWSKLEPGVHLGKCSVGHYRIFSSYGLHTVRFIRKGSERLINTAYDLAAAKALCEEHLRSITALS